MSFTYLMDNKTQIAGHEAWSVEHMINVERKQAAYILGNYVINDGKLYTIEFSAPPQKVHENLPTAQKMIDLLSTYCNLVVKATSWPDK
jgi:hypothetical protein